jgi:hypothetical protein
MSESKQSITPIQIILCLPLVSKDSFPEKSIKIRNNAKGEIQELNIIEKSEFISPSNGK